ncbi:MAG: DNA alkylation repair protein [Clostridiales bacterium]|nr:DNA alkylation repair protein [Clostridiales bacterium]
MFDYEALLSQLNELREESYAAFNRKLLPGTSNIWGIRLPNLRKIAKQIKKMDVLDYFSQVKHEFFEETLLMGFVIGTMEESKYPLDEIQRTIESFLPHIHNWSVCDSFCASLKIAKSNPDAIFDFLKGIYDQSIKRNDQGCIFDNNRINIDEEQEYIIRFVIVMWLNYYIKDDYIDEVVARLLKIRSEQYYVNMAIAWCYSIIYISYPKVIEDYLKQNIVNQSNLVSSDLFVHNKTISKICESYQVEEERKKEIRSLKIKGK